MITSKQSFHKIKKQTFSVTHLCSFSIASFVTLPTSLSLAAVIRPPYRVMAWGLAVKDLKHHTDKQGHQKQNFKM